jgi:hypothetical protein
MPTGACSMGFKHRSREGECPKPLDVVASCGRSIGECGVLFVLLVLFVVLDLSPMMPASPFIVQGGLVYKG